MAGEQYSQSYKSPLLAKFENEGRITMAQMRSEVPPYQAGRAATLELRESAIIGVRRRRALEEIISKGEQAKERLLRAGIPLIKSFALKEYKRRQAWQSSISFEDLFQDATVGYLRGLLSYNPTGDYKSPTNYIGQWIITEMRRSSEPLDNDFEVSHESSERFRRIRAIRSRLASELSRTPTAEEIVIASNDPITGPGALMGKASRRGQPKPLTLDQVEEERACSMRVGYTSRIAPANDEEGTLESGTVLADYAQPVLGNSLVDGATALVEQSVSDGLCTVILLTMDALGMSAVHQEIVSRRFGLAPYLEEETPREIAKNMNITSTVASKTVSAFQHEMYQPNGQFHRVCAALGPDTRDDFSLSWVMKTFGEFNPHAEAPEVHAYLKEEIKRKSAAPPPPRNPLASGSYGQFHCDYHDRSFTARYRVGTEVPKEHSCPSCHRPSRLIRTAES
jgi:DNA-directed RNA polymerase sigma subunit (sigma70/sigma32)